MYDWQVDWDNKYSIHNWIEQLDIYCIDSKYIGYIGAYTFAGAAMGCLFLPLLGDWYGRWHIYMITCAV